MYTYSTNGQCLGAGCPGMSSTPEQAQAAVSSQSPAPSPTRRRRQNGAALLLRALALARGPAGSFLLGGDPEIDMGILASPDALNAAVVHAGTRNAMNSTGARGSTVNVSSMFVPFVNLGAICVGLMVETAQVQSDGRGVGPEGVRNAAMSRYALNTETGELLRVRNSVKPALIVELQWTGLPIGDFVRERVTLECDRRLFAAGRLEDSVLRFQRSTRVGGGECAGLRPSGPRDMARGSDNLAHNAGLVHEFVSGMPSLRENLRLVVDGADAARYGLLVAAVQGHSTIAGQERSAGMAAELHGIAMKLGSERMKLANAHRARQETENADDASEDAPKTENAQVLAATRNAAREQQRRVVLEDGMGGQLDLNELEFAASDLTCSPDLSAWSPSPRASSKDVASPVVLINVPGMFETLPVAVPSVTAVPSQLPPHPASTTTDRTAKAGARIQNPIAMEQYAAVVGDFVEDGCVSQVTDPRPRVTARRPQMAAAAEFGSASNGDAFGDGDDLDGDDGYRDGDGYHDDGDDEMHAAHWQDERAGPAGEGELAKEAEQAAAIAAAELVDRERQEQADACLLKRKMARRVYNIAAAKRSNKRRREAYENLVTGLKEAHARATQLRELESTLRTTNIELRRRVRQKAAEPGV